MEDDDRGGGDGEGARLKRPWEVGAPSPARRSRSRESSTKNRAGSLKREVGGGVREGKGGEQLCWGDGTMRSRSGSCPGRERKAGGSGKRVVVSHEGSAKSQASKSRSGSGKRVVESGNGKVVIESREGSVKSRGSRDGSCKKEVWVPPASEVSKNTTEKPVPPPYDSLEPRFASYPLPFSIINESYFTAAAREELFDDPKYAAVSVGDLPQLVSHQSLDPIVPLHSCSHLYTSKRQYSSSSGLQGSRVKAASSRSLQGSGSGSLGGRGGGGGGGGGEGGEGGGVGGGRGSIYHTHDSTPVRGIGTSVSGNIASRLSMPLESYYS